MRRVATIVPSDRERWAEREKIQFANPFYLRVVSKYMFGLFTEWKHCPNVTEIQTVFDKKITVQQNNHR